LHFDHHSSHAASAYCYSGFEESLAFVADCCGEKSCTSLYIGSGKGLRKIKSFDVPHSLGIMYSIMTKYLGFNTFQDEYKVMGLASYGTDRYRKEFGNFIKYDKQGNYFIDKKNIFRLEAFIGPARKSGEPITERHKDIARTAQSILEDILINMLTYYREKTGIKKLCMAGGIALNCVANGKIYEEHIFDDIFVQPMSSDAGTALGAAALANFKLNGEIQIEFDNMYLGTEYSDEAIEETLKASALKYQYLSDDIMIKTIAKCLEEGKIGGLFRGRMEAGPRALGNRSVIASPIQDDMLERINRIKSREMFRPIAPIIKEDKFDQYFSGAKNQYMLFACSVKPEAKKYIKAVTHVDNTSRVQAVTIKSNKFVYLLIDEFERLTGVPVIINTSLNFYGLPIVESPVDAIGSFYSSGLDFLVIGSYFLHK
jgi:carbamoyltransferase